MNVTKYLLPPRVRTLFKSHTSLWISSRGSEFLVIEWKGVRTCLPWTHISHLEVVSKEDLGIRFKLIIFLIELKLTCPIFHARYHKTQCSKQQELKFFIRRIYYIETNRYHKTQCSKQQELKFFIRRIYYIETKKAITNKAFSNEDIWLGDYKLIGFLDNPIASFKKWRFADQISPKGGYMQDALKSQNYSWGHSEINTCSSLYLSSGVICQDHASSTLFLIGFKSRAISTDVNIDFWV